MRTHARTFAAAAALTAAICLLAGPGAAGDKGQVWKQFLPADAYKELVSRAAKNVEEALTGKPSEEAVKKAQFNALLIAGYAMSAEGAQLSGMPEAALHLAKFAGQKGKQDEARKMAEALGAGRVTSNGGKAKFGDAKAYLADRADLMEHFKTRAKGGEGIHPSLQSNIRLKGTQNGIEEKLRSLAMKKVSEANAKKESAELALLGYRAAVVGAVTYFYAPKKNAQEWHDLSLAMRDAGIALADAAKKKDAEAISKAANSLNSSCNQCHSAFRGKS